MYVGGEGIGSTSSRRAKRLFLSPQTKVLVGKREGIKSAQTAAERGGEKREVKAGQILDFP